MGFIDKIIGDQKRRVTGHTDLSGWQRVSWQLARKTSAMMVRGMGRGPFLRSRRGQVLLGRGVRIHNPQFISVGANFVVEDFAEIQGLARDGLVFGNSVSIGSGAMIRPSSYYSRDIGVGLVMGDRSSMGPNCYIGCSGGIEIGDDVMLGPGVRLFAENHNFDDADSESIKEQGVTWSPIVIEDGAWLASGVTVTSGVRIGKGAVIAAGAVVTRDVPAGGVYGGIPARDLKKR